MNARFQIAIHILTLLEKAEGELLASDYIAGSLNTNPALVRKEISNLRTHGLIISKEGKGGGYTLSKSSASITLADIYNSIKQPAVLGAGKNEPNPRCPVGRQINEQIGLLYQEMDFAIIKQLKNTTLKSFSNKFK